MKECDHFPTPLVEFNAHCPREIPDHLIASRQHGLNKDYLDAIKLRLGDPKRRTGAMLGTRKDWLLLSREDL